MIAGALQWVAGLLSAESLIADSALTTNPWGSASRVTVGFTSEEVIDYGAALEQHTLAVIVRAEVQNPTSEAGLGNIANTIADAIRDQRNATYRVERPFRTTRAQDTGEGAQIVTTFSVIWTVEI